MKEKIKVYEMEMEFEVIFGLRSVNDFMNKMGLIDERTGLRYIFTLKQTIPFVPDEAYFEKVADIFREKYKEGNLEILKCEFIGYKKFLEKEVEVEGE